MSEVRLAWWLWANINLYLIARAALKAEEHIWRPGRDRGQSLATLINSYQSFKFWLNVRWPTFAHYLRERMQFGCPMQRHYSQWWEHTANFLLVYPAHNVEVNNLKKFVHKQKDQRCDLYVDRNISRMCRKLFKMYLRFETVYTLSWTRNTCKFL